ncbi:MAG: class I SAM-dependent methyltransferase [Chloroflexota bacterium]
MPTHKEIYARHAQEYEALVSREDHEGHILKTIREILPPEGLDILDLGTGTGRLAALMLARARSLLAFDLSPNMLTVARDEFRRLGPKHRWLAAAADHRRLPLASGTADLIVSGWSVSYVAIWHPDTWRREVDMWLTEAARVLRPKGRVILFESLGTGNASPERLPHLEDFYDWLDHVGFAKTWIRTDYRFETVELAEELTGFFFGEAMRARIQRESLITLPECTGVWWKQL